MAVKTEIFYQKAGFAEIIAKGEPLHDGYFVLTPPLIERMSEADRHTVAEAAIWVLKSRYGQRYGDNKAYDSAELTGQLNRARLGIEPPDNAVYMWLAGTKDGPVFTNSISYRPPGEAKLVKSVKLPGPQHQKFHGGTLMAQRLSFIKEHLPFIQYWHVDSRASSTASVTASAKSTDLIPTGIEIKSWIPNDDGTMIQSPSVVMMGLRYPENLPQTHLYAPPHSATADFLSSISGLMHARWHRKIYTIVESDPSNIRQDELSQENLNLRFGDYASAKVLNANGTLEQIARQLSTLTEKIFQKGLRYFTVELNPADPSTLAWQIALGNLRFMPTRFWPPVGEDDKPTLRFGILNPAVSKVMEMNLPTDFQAFEFPLQTQKVVSVLKQSGEGLIGERAIFPDPFP